MELDAHRKPPEYLRRIYKSCRHASEHTSGQTLPVLDAQSLLLSNSECTSNDMQAPTSEGNNRIFASYLSEDADGSKTISSTKGLQSSATSTPAFRTGIANLDGLLVYPGLIPMDVQRKMLSRLLHRDLTDPEHLTNVHLHHDIEIPRNIESYFDLPVKSEAYITPKCPQSHKAMTVRQFLEKKLRWMTLGGQYDWTRKTYPPGDIPVFPYDLAKLLHGLFPQTKPEAAIVNLYSPGDTLSLHRDVAEESDKGLISVSIGCDALFVIGFDPEQTDADGDHAVLRLKSGDAVYMSGRSRFAWHGVPQIIPNTCPQELRDWPAEAGQDQYKDWAGWMASKRINLNVRQMNSSTIE